MTLLRSLADGVNSTESDAARETDAGRTPLLPRAPSPAGSTEHAEQPCATHTVLDRYGSEVRNFLSSRTTTRMSMEDVFSMFSVDVWKGLPSVREQGQVRSWLYVVARNALARHLRLKQRWRSRHVSAEPDELQVDTRRSIATRLGDIAQLEPILAGLGEADRRLLEQRSMLAMPWRDIALESARRSNEAVSVSEADIARESARLRKRYQLLLETLRAHVAILADPRDSE
jgi:RNA polymerase sigma factor (sigma-70 family)